MIESINLPQNYLVFCFRCLQFKTLFGEVLYEIFLNQLYQISPITISDICNQGILTYLVTKCFILNLVL